ncbi:MAG TPA: carboxypeptidase-like regulatory domain-containing protein [Bryobacteraceae bacterium]|nr:carboxypeptidase-like regulatory domain-containing protein [Bryobacteraceae bacterium]
MLLCLAATPGWPQATSSTGTVSGRVMDQQGAVVPAADVTLLDITTSARRTAATNEAGRYVFVSVPPGTYDIVVSRSGFQTARVSAQKVTVGQELTIDLTLTVGGVTQSIDVVASAAAQLQTTSATVGATLTGASVILLPNLSRDAYALQTLNVGVTPAGEVAGTRNDQNTYLVDGANVTDDNSGNLSYNTMPNLSAVATGVIPTPVESIEEFKMATSNQTADFSNSAGSQIQMITKRGTNQFHGSLYEYYFGSNVGAANYWKNNHTKLGSLPYTPLPSTHYNRFGVTAGGPIAPEFLGGKWYVFGNYDGYRFPNTTTFEATVPTALMRAGVIQVQDKTGKYAAYNLNPFPVTVNGVTYPVATCGANSIPCDPRGIGLNPVVNQLWSKYMPLPNDPQYGDTYNTQGYNVPIRIPETANTVVARVDHDFTPKWHFMGTYRYYKDRAYGTSQVDIGGLLPGCVFGQACSVYTIPNEPWSMVGGMTTIITSHLTNDFRFAYVRNLWAYGSAMAPPQLSGLPGALEIGGETANALIPYNVNNQSVRAREWNGQDKQLKDDVSYLRGNHFFQFGGSFQRNFDQMYRTDNGAGIMSALVYQIYDTGINIDSRYQPTTIASSSASTWNHLYAEVLGLVNQPQALFTRKLPALTLNPIGTPMFPRAIINYYNAYMNDTWHVRPKVTLSYGLGYMVERPPYELTGQQVITVDPNNQPLSVPAYLDAKQKAALAGQVYNPVIGMTLVRNVAGGGMKYPYNDFFGGLSPRVAVAWNPSFGDGILAKIFGYNDTVIRAGYSRIFGRLNGVKQVMSLVNNTGVGQPISCVGASKDGGCLGNLGVDPTTAFRIGTDGMTAPMPTLTATLPQPYFPGVGVNPAAGDGAGIDPDFKPNRSDQFTFSIQRAISRKFILEAGYIGKIIRNEFLPINLDAVPYMLTLNGQSFDKAWANLYNAVSTGATPAVQPWFEAAMGGASSAYCSPYSSCTAAVAALQKTNINGTRVYDFWAALARTSSWTLGRTQPSSNPAQVTSLIQYTSLGYGNYNAGYVSFTADNWHGLVARSNFTWSRALGTGFLNQSNTQRTVLDAWDIHANYGAQPFDIKFIYNLSMTYQSPFYKSQKGIVGHLLGGWSIAPIFTAQTGSPLRVTTSSGNSGAFGEIFSSSGSADCEGAALAAPFTGGNSAHYNVTVPSGAGINGNASVGGSGINIFADPVAVAAEFRRLTLGIDHNGGGWGMIRGFNTWNVDTSVSKEIRATEKVAATLMFQITNILNHFQAANPTVSIDSPASFGVVTAQANTPRRMEFGLRIHF